jgi:Uma2 family endonuclease
MLPPDARDTPLVTPRRFTLEEYHRLIHVGVLGEDEHVELLEGVIVEMTPQGRAHMLVVTRLTRVLVRTLSDAYSVRPQGPLSLEGDSEPEPDIAVVTRAEEEQAEAHPRTALLVVEVAGDSLRKDRQLKGRIYARARVGEYWIVDVARGTVEVYTEPDAEAGRYRAMRTLGAGETLTASVLPGLALPVAELFA